VWEGFSTMLKRGGGDDSLPREEPPPAPPVTAHWRVADDTGRRYAAVSGDHNPIHLHGLAAKAFGFPWAIAHGMWTKARCLAALRVPDAFEIDVKFRKPVLLPSTVTFGEAGSTFAVHGHLEGLGQFAGCPRRAGRPAEPSRWTDEAEVAARHLRADRQRRLWQRLP
jgi:hypothetical protein